MGKTTNRGKGLLLLDFSVAIYLFVTGIMGITGRSRGGEIGTAVNSLFASGAGDFNRVLIVILSVMAIAAGIFILIKIFGITISHTEILLIILAITWLVFILMIDIIYPLNHRGGNFLVLEWLRGFSSHAMVLASIVIGTKKFGI